MKKKNPFIVVFITILCVAFLISSAWAGEKHRYRWEGIAIGIGAVMLGHALLNQYHPRDLHPDPPHIYPQPPSPKIHRHWEMRRVWIPPTYKRVWNPGHYNHKGRWVSGRWIEVVKKPGYWSKKRERIGRLHHRYSH